MMRTTSFGLARLIAWLALLAGAIWLLTALGRGSLAVPSLLEPGAWASWIQDTDPVTAAFALLRAVTLAVAWYLAGATLVGVAARLLAQSRLIAAADVIAVPAVRRILQAAFGAGLAAASLSAGSNAVVPEHPPATVAAAAPAPDHSLEMTPARDDVVMTPEPVPVLSQAPEDGSKTWTVRPGDHFWSIAEHVLTKSTGQRPTDEETTAYWHRLVERNRDRLVDPGNPDLIHPGQRFELPDVNS